MNRIVIVVIITIPFKMDTRSVEFNSSIFEMDDLKHITSPQEQANILAKLNDISFVVLALLEHKEKTGPPKFKFGKYKGQPIKSAPESYIKWIMSPKCNLYDDSKKFIHKVYYAPE